MHHEVAVPIPVRLIWDALRDPDRLAECIPGLLPDTRPARSGDGGPEITGRLRLRVGTTSVTYRGVLTVTEADDLPLALVATASGTEVRGAAAVHARLRVRLDDEGPDTRLVFDGDLTASGRTADLDPLQLHAAAVRLADRFTAALAEALTPLRDQENPAALLGRAYLAEEADDLLLGVGPATAATTTVAATVDPAEIPEADSPYDPGVEDDYDPHDPYDVYEGAGSRPAVAAPVRARDRRRLAAVLVGLTLVLVWLRLRRRRRA